MAAEIVTRCSFGEVEVFHHYFTRVQLVALFSCRKQILYWLEAITKNPFGVTEEIKLGH